jgi:hypothetical protein
MQIKAPLLYATKEARYGPRSIQSPSKGDTRAYMRSKEPFPRPSWLLRRPYALHIGARYILISLPGGALTVGDAEQGLQASRPSTLARRPSWLQRRLARSRISVERFNGYDGECRKILACGVIGKVDWRGQRPASPRGYFGTAPRHQLVSSRVQASTCARHQKAHDTKVPA